MLLLEVAASINKGAGTPDFGARFRDVEFTFLVVVANASTVVVRARGIAIGRNPLLLLLSLGS